MLSSLILIRAVNFLALKVPNDLTRPLQNFPVSAQVLPRMQKFQESIKEKYQGISFDLRFYLILVFSVPLQTKVVVLEVPLRDTDLH